MDLILGSTILLPDAPEQLREELKNQLTLKNPKWVENNHRGRWNRGTPEFLTFYSESDDGPVLPRGYMRPLINTCKRFGIEFKIIDKRRKLEKADFTFSGELKPFQQKAVDEMLKKEFGVLTAATGAGKTVMGLYLICSREQPALIIVHTKELLNQWVSRIETFLKIPGDEIGIIGAGKFNIGQRISVGMVQTLYKHAPRVSPHVGHIVVDECHRTPSRTFNECISRFDARYMTGLSATPFRRDRLSRLIFWHLGEMVHEVDKSLLIARGDILRAEVVFRETEFDTQTDASQYYAKVLGELAEDDQRNRLICSDVAEESKRGEGVCLVLSDRKAHCEAIGATLGSHHGIASEVLTGDLSPKQRKELLERLAGGEVKVLIATGQLIGEGFDCKDLSTLFLATPVKFGGRLLQYLGRVLRPAPGKKKAKVFDYVDIRVGVLEAAAKSRSYIYNREMG